MSTWKEVVEALDDNETWRSARDVIVETVTPLSNVEAVKALLHLAPLAETLTQQSALAEILANRLDGPLAWGLIHANREIPEIRNVAELALELCADRDDTAEKSDHQSLTDSAAILAELGNAPEETQLHYTLFLAGNSKGANLSTYVEFLQQRTRLDQLVELLETGAKTTLGFTVAREVARTILGSLSPTDRAEQLLLGLSQAVPRRDVPTITYLCQCAMSESLKHPNFELWRIEQYLQSQIVGETRRSLTSWLGWSGRSGLSEIGVILEATCQSLRKNLPDPALPRPAPARSLSNTNLPSPAEITAASDLDLPIPALEMTKAKKQPWWRR